MLLDFHITVRLTAKELVAEVSGYLGKVVQAQAVPREEINTAAVEAAAVVAAAALEWAAGLAVSAALTAAAEVAVALKKA
jgi:hypothetical protein